MSFSVRRRASSSLGPLLCCFLLTASEVNVRAEPPIRNVVGLGATKCEGFIPTLEQILRCDGTIWLGLKDS